MFIIRFSNIGAKFFLLEDLLDSERLNIENKEFKVMNDSLKNKGFLGFFDWLRYEEKEIVGIRLCPFEHEPVFQLLSSLTYLKKTFNEKCFELLFKGNEFDEKLSGDQDFTNNYVYTSEDGDFLITFRLDGLGKEECNSLQKFATRLDMII